MMGPSFAERLTHHELRRLLQTTRISEIAQQYGVSCSLVSRWRRRLHIPCRGLPHGVREQQVLTLLDHEANGMTSRELRQHIPIKRQTMHTLLHRLARAGFVVYVRSPAPRYGESSLRWYRQSVHH